MVNILLIIILCIEKERCICQAHRSLDIFSEGNETCNRCLDRNKRWAEKNREREKKKREKKDEEGIQ